MTEVRRVGTVVLAEVSRGGRPEGGFSTLNDMWPCFCYSLAQANPPAGGGEPTNQLFSMLLIIAPIFVFWYLLVLMPQNKERAKRQDMLKSLKKNDSVVTIGGILGSVVNLSEDGTEVTLRVDDNARIKLRRDAIREVLVKEKDKVESK